MVTLVESDIVGGAAHLRDCIPSKTMIATGGALTFAGRISGMGLHRLAAEAAIDLDALRNRVVEIQGHLHDSTVELLTSQGVRMIRGTGRPGVGPTMIVVETEDGIEELTADAILVCTGSRPRIPDWAEPDGERVLTTQQAYPPPELPRHLVVIGSGVTGVEFVHMFTSFGSQVTLIVSRQQVLPTKVAEVAAELENELIRRGVRLFKGAQGRGGSTSDDGEGVSVLCDDGRVARGSHALLAIGSIPNSRMALGLADTPEWTVDQVAAT